MKLHKNEVKLVDKAVQDEYIKEALIKDGLNVGVTDKKVLAKAKYYQAVQDQIQRQQIA